MAIDLSEQSITPNTDLFSAGFADNSKSFYIHPSIHSLFMLIRIWIYLPYKTVLYSFVLFFLPLFLNPTELFHCIFP